jgi:hypothetical protein
MLAPFAPARRRTGRRLLRAALAASAALPASIHAQGSLSGQGFGYPTGSLSTRAQGTAGALGEFDPTSPINPAALAGWGRSALFFQYDPEFRSIEAGDARQRTSASRFPLVATALRVRERYTVGLAASTFLDRTWTTTFRSTQRIGEQDITSNVRFESKGSIADIRLAGAAVVTPNLRVGIAGHVLTGQNQLFVGESFIDTLRFGTLSDSSIIDYSGAAASAGVEWRPLRQLGLAASYRMGGTLRARRGDTTLTTGQVPDRIGLGVRFDGITGASIAASYARTAWGEIRELGSARLQVDEGPELAIGLEAAGPRVAERLVTLRLGGRQRTLPFGIGGSEVRELALNGGFGLPLAGDRAAFDFSAQRARRTTDAQLGGQSAAETAWTLSIGLIVRP